MKVNKISANQTLSKIKKGLNNAAEKVKNNWQNNKEAYTVLGATGLYVASLGLIIKHAPDGPAFGVDGYHHDELVKGADGKYHIVDEPGYAALSDNADNLANSITDDASASLLENIIENVG